MHETNRVHEPWKEQCTVLCTLSLFLILLILQLNMSL